MTRNTVLAAGMILAATIGTSPAVAGEADVVAAEARRAADGSWTFSVTVRHADTGWDHYADAWEVRAPDGTVLGTRTLLHPHVEEQPFTRSLGGVAVPDDVATVTICARDSVHAFDGACVDVDLDDGD